tara:strand:- start:429 stop:590 length:162 start_codon:yes stop_codon:yes gene_type:complete
MISRSKLPKEEGGEIRSLMERKIKIISWLLPRFHKGLSNPENYQELIGSVDYE